MQRQPKLKGVNLKKGDYTEATPYGGVCEVTGEREDMEDTAIIHAGGEVETYFRLDKAAQAAAMQTTFFPVQQSLGNKGANQGSCVGAANGWIDGNKAVVSASWVGDVVVLQIIMDEKGRLKEATACNRNLHDGDNVKEREAIERGEGRSAGVVSPNGRLVGQTGLLAVTRALGDKNYDNAGISHRPETEVTISKVNVAATDRVYVVVTCDGAMEHLKNAGPDKAQLFADQVGKLFARNPDVTDPVRLSELIVEHAFAQPTPTSDNVTVLVMGNGALGVVNDGHNGNAVAEALRESFVPHLGNAVDIQVLFIEYKNHEPQEGLAAQTAFNKLLNQEPPTREEMGHLDTFIKYYETRDVHDKNLMGEIRKIISQANEFLAKKAESAAAVNPIQPDNKMSTADKRARLQKIARKGNPEPVAAEPRVSATPTLTKTTTAKSQTANLMQAFKQSAVPQTAVPLSKPNSAAGKSREERLKMLKGVSMDKRVKDAENPIVQVRSALKAQAQAQTQTQAQAQAQKAPPVAIQVPLASKADNIKELKNAYREFKVKKSDVIAFNNLVDAISTPNQKEYQENPLMRASSKLFKNANLMADPYLTRKAVDNDIKVILKLTDMVFKLSPTGTQQHQQVLNKLADLLEKIKAETIKLAGNESAEKISGIIKNIREGVNPKNYQEQTIRPVMK